MLFFLCPSFYLPYRATGEDVERVAWMIEKTRRWAISAVSSRPLEQLCAGPHQALWAQKLLHLSRTPAPAPSHSDLFVFYAHVRPRRGDPQHLQWWICVLPLTIQASISFWKAGSLKSVSFDEQQSSVLERKCFPFPALIWAHLWWSGRDYDPKWYITQCSKDSISTQASSRSHKTPPQSCL